MSNKKPTAIGILGGTFDPVHMGHLRLSLEIQQTLHLDHVRLMPCYLPVHRPPPIASAEHRLAMLQIAVESEALLQVDSREIYQHAPVYTIDSIQSLKNDFGAAHLCLIMGNDVFIHLNSWREYENLLNYCHIIVAHRPSFSISPHSPLHEKLHAHYTQNKDDLFSYESGKIYFQKITGLSISATDIRDQCRNGYNARFLLPDPVYHYINTHKLYRG
jgi:nicotinate-nucleotide adenylyltransferase